MTNLSSQIATKTEPDTNFRGKKNSLLGGLTPRMVPGSHGYLLVILKRRMKIFMKEKNAHNGR